jgi:hypothetical protein
VPHPGLRPAPRTRRVEDVVVVVKEPDVTQVSHSVRQAVAVLHKCHTVSDRQ